VYAGIPRDSLARYRWAVSGPQARTEVLRLAEAGRAHPDPAVAAVAVGWAWEVLGPPWARRARSPCGYAASVLWSVIDAAALTGPVRDPQAPPASWRYDGDPRQDRDRRVRRAARRVEAANLAVLMVLTSGSGIGSQEGGRR
jgi:hypothetical protein